MTGLPVGVSMLFFAVITLLGLYFVLLLFWQIRVLRGKCVENPDGSVDDWHNERCHFGIALADVFVACPVGILGVILSFAGSRWGFWLLSLASFFFIWAYVMRSATSLKFFTPKIGFSWIMTFPFGAVLGVVYLVVCIIYFDVLFLQ